MSLVEALLPAVEQAAILCHRVQREFLNVREKEGQEPVTIADYGSQALLCRAIALAYPGDAIIAEESGTVFGEIVPPEQQATVTQLLSEILGEGVTIAQVVAWLNHGQGVEAARTWVIDPIDGTKGFISRRHYSIAVGVLQAGRPDPIAGILGTPQFTFAGQAGSIFYADGGQALAKAIGGSRLFPVEVSQRHNPADLRLLESVEPEHTDRNRLLEVYKAAGLHAPRPQRLDGQDKYAFVACGQSDLYVRIPGSPGWRHKIWDHAAGVALVQAAGGVVSDLDGQPLDFSQGRVLPNQGMIVSNALLHAQIVAAVEAVQG